MSEALQHHHSMNRRFREFECILPVALLSCSSASTGATATEQLAPGTWTVESGMRVPEGSASATIRTASGALIMYLPGLELRTSTDGLTWSASQHLSLAEPGEFLRNPAVVQLANGSFVMIYEGVRDERLPSRTTRLYRATSSNGLTFVKTPGALANGAVLVSTAADGDFVSAPDIIKLADQSLRIYFNTSDGARLETARSTDDGVTWTREGPVSISGIEADRRPADPDILALPANGGYRLFFAAGMSGSPTPRILSATSSDGLDFVLDAGERLSPADYARHRVDPDVLEYPAGTYRMYFGEALQAQGPYGIRSAMLGRE